MTRLQTLVLATAAASFITTVADAHPQLKQAGPAPGSVVATSPKAIRIEFNEAVVANFSGVEITDQSGKKYGTGAASLGANDKKQLIVPVTGDLAPGKYTVNWHAVGDDTHRVEGRFNFEVKP
jgi:methionine-rich copper-binding protein CopC